MTPVLIWGVFKMKLIFSLNIINMGTDKCFSVEIRFKSKFKHFENNNFPELLLKKKLMMLKNSYF
ncbi:hypothetical protein EAG08_10225 [Chryseobacterium sp. 3008163]|nr:hypothetical protein EAG08_10225 [Chryseobacterium sp. 3008163]